LKRRELLGRVDVDQAPLVELDDDRLELAQRIPERELAGGELRLERRQSS
jgi:hypothetical protein